MAITNPDPNFPGDKMVQVNPAVSDGPRINVDNGAGGLSVYNKTTDTVSVPEFEVQYLQSAKLIA